MIFTIGEAASYHSAYHFFGWSHLVLKAIIAFSVVILTWIMCFLMLASAFVPMLKMEYLLIIPASWCVFCVTASVTINGSLYKHYLYDLPVYFG